MTLTLVTGPTALPVSLEEAKQHLRIEDDQTSEDALITALIRAATEHLDGRDGWLGRSLLTQTWDLTLDHFPCPRTPATGFQGPYFAADAIRVPLPPLQSVTSITYTDSDGTEQTLATSAYTVDIKSQPGRITPAFDQIWPVTRDQVNAVVIRFVAGYGGAGSDVPQAIRQALLLMLGHWYENRQTVLVGVTAADLPLAADALLAPYRVWGFG